MSSLQLTQLSYNRTNGAPTTLVPKRDGPRVLITRGNEQIVAEGRKVRYIPSTGRAPWVYHCAGTPNNAHLSGNRLLITTSSLDYHAWGNLGPALLLNLTDGSLIAALQGGRGAAMEGEQFILGLEGYDAFDTWLYDRDGTLQDKWRSYGHYFVDPDGSVRVVECDRNCPTNSQVVKLHRQGVIERGPCLLDGQVPTPVALPDGTIVLFDCGTLKAIDCALKEEVLANLLPISPSQSWRFSGALALKDNLVVTIEERDEDALIYTTHRWIFSLK